MGSVNDLGVFDVVHNSSNRLINAIYTAHDPKVWHLLHKLRETNEFLIHWCEYPPRVLIRVFARGLNVLSALSGRYS